MPEPEISVLLVDDHSLVRKGFRRMLEDEPGIRVVGEASDGHEAVTAVGVLKPRVVVMDFSLPSMNGAVATRRIRELHPETEVLILSMHAEPSYVRTCLEAGARGYLLKNAMDLELVSAVRKVAAGEQTLDRRLGKLAEPTEGLPKLSTRELEVLQLIVHGKSNKEIAVVFEPEREHRGGASRQHHADVRYSQYGRAGCLRDSYRPGEHRVTRRTFVLGAVPLAGLGSAAADPGFRLADVTAQAGIAFHHNNGAFGAKYLPETLGPGCAFLDYDGDGWLDILLVNGWVGRGHIKAALHAGFVSQQSQRNVSPMSRAAPGWGWKCTGWAQPWQTTTTMASPISSSRPWARTACFRTPARGTFVDVTEKSGLGDSSGFSTSALWFDYDRDGLLDLFVCNYVQWSPEHDVFCSVDGKNKSYCTPEAYHGATCWLFRNRGNGTFEDVTAKSGIFDSTSKSLGVAMLDYDRDGWPDLFVANDTQPNKLYRNRRDGTFEDVGVRAGVAFSEDGRARAGMGADAADFDNSGVAGIAITNFDDEMIALYRPRRRRHL